VDYSVVIKTNILTIYSSYKITSSERKLAITLDFINLEYSTLHNDARVEGKSLVESEQLDIQVY